MLRKVLLEYLSTRASLDKFMHAYYGLSLPRKLWVMVYKGFMGYGRLWVKRGMGYKGFDCSSVRAGAKERPRLALLI